MQGLFPFSKGERMFELLTFIFTLIVGIVVTIMFTTNKTVTEAIDCVESIFKTGHWSSR